LTAVVVPIGLLVAAGCTAAGGGTTPSASSAVPVDTISAEIEEELTRRDDVASAEVFYNDDVTVSASAMVDVTMEPGADPQALHDEALRLVWESRLNPLNTIAVNVIDPVEPLNGLSSSVDLLDAADREPLEEQYGPHPQ
jgi:hypothetical protein